MVVRGAGAEVVRVTTPGPPLSPESIKLRLLALNLKPKASSFMGVSSVYFQMEWLLLLRWESSVGS